jgi:hypothetical protein
MSKLVDQVIIGGVADYKGGQRVTVLLRDNRDDILWATGVTVPTNSKPGFAKGCLFIDTNVAAGTTGLYCNKGTRLLCEFTAVTQA